MGRTGSAANGKPPFFPAARLTAGQQPARTASPARSRPAADRRLLPRGGGADR